MAIGRHCKNQFWQNSRVRTTFLGISLVLAITTLLPTAFAEQYQEGDYLHHLWRLQDDARRDQELYMNDWNANRTRSRFCAIAYSPKTYEWGYSWGKGTRGDAEREAKKRCGTADAEILCWSKGEWYCALADGPKSYGAAPGATPEIAKAEALRIAGETAPGSKIVLLVGGNPPVVNLYLDKKKETAKTK